MNQTSTYYPCSCNVRIDKVDHMECLYCGKTYSKTEPVKIVKKICSHVYATRIASTDPNDTRRYCKQCGTTINH